MGPLNMIETSRMNGALTVELGNAPRDTTGIQDLNATSLTLLDDVRAIYIASHLYLTVKSYVL
jgi:hypothetical protein